MPILNGHVLDMLRTIPNESIDLVTTSPPYYSARQYPIPDVVWDEDPSCEHEWGDTIPRVQEGGGNRGVPPEWQRRSRAAHTGGNSGQYCQKCYAWKGQLGQEPTYQLFVKHLIDIFREVYRVLKKTGSCYVVIDDTYKGSGSSRHIGYPDKANAKGRAGNFMEPAGSPQGHIKNKSRLAVPERFMLGMLDDVGFLYRSDIVWYKNNGLPFSGKDRFADTWEHVYCFTKTGKNYFNMDNVREAYSEGTMKRAKTPIFHNKPAHMSQVGSLNKFFESLGVGKGIDTTHETKYLDDFGDNMSSPPYNSIRKFGRLTIEQQYKLNRMSEHLRERSDASGMTRQMIADMIGIPEPMYSRFMQDAMTRRMIPDRELWDAISEVINLESYDSFVDGESAAVYPRATRKGKNPGDMWQLSTESLHESHVAPYPSKLVARIIAASCPPDGHVLDPFMGSGTTAMVCEAFNTARWDRISGMDKAVKLDEVKRIAWHIQWTGIELSPEYNEMIGRRIDHVIPRNQDRLTSFGVEI